jgi:hypothetical protein
MKTTIMTTADGLMSFIEETMFFLLRGSLLAIHGALCYAKGLLCVCCVFMYHALEVHRNSSNLRCSQCPYAKICKTASSSDFSMSCSQSRGYPFT